MINKVFMLVFLTYISLVASNLAPFITKCKWDDSKCLKESTQKAIPFFADGIPELNVTKHDPLVIKIADASTPVLIFTVYDMKVTGLKNCQVMQITRDIKTLKLSVKFQCAINITGNYKILGELFALPIRGNGDLTAIIPKIQISVDLLMMDKTGKDGKKHWGVKSYKHYFELKEESNVKFENLFPENELLRKSTEERISKNGNGVIKEIGPPIIKAIAYRIIVNILKFFDSVPVEDLALD